MIADDNDQLRKLFKLMLKDHEIVEARDGQEAVELCKKNSPDLILMDILMPELDGIKATSKILAEHPNIPILAITAYSTKTQLILDAGAKAVLIKPIRKEVLLNKVAEFLNGQSKS